MPGAALLPPALQQILVKPGWREYPRSSSASPRLCVNLIVPSLLLTDGANPMYVANQMGHKDWSMIRTVYGRYIKENQCIPFI